MLATCAIYVFHIKTDIFLYIKKVCTKVNKITAKVFQWVFEIIKIINKKKNNKNLSIYQMVSIDKIKNDLSEFRINLTVYIYM